ncbi:MAG: 3-dehydroquinate synthase [Alphaproteobacteria bacterium]|nr:3-dehydroquinate synthase [Alphaproteobacteria bacterium]
MTDAKIVHVDLADRSYDIHIGKGLLEKAADLIPIDLSDKKVFILYDKNTYPYVQVLEEALAGKIAESKTLGLKGGEPTKSYESLQQTLDWLLEGKVNRQSIMIVVGGGVVGDLGGFAASIIMRGIPFVQVPTTLLSQVDSSVGGKTGINTRHGKNLVGSFYQPQCVLCDIGTLGTLPERELQAGYAEIVKYGLINDLQFFEWLEENGDQVLALENKAIGYAVEKSCQAKATIVAADEQEKGQRALLNLGHTFAHALEAAAEYDGRLLHGEAVSIGMVMAFSLSQKMELCSAEDVARVETHLKSHHLKTRISDINPELRNTPEELFDLMRGDKKAQGEKIGFILTHGIGEAFQNFDVAREDVLAVLQNSLEGQI